MFQKFEHPSIGPISTPRRAARLDGHIRLARLKPRSARYLMASFDGKPLGIATLFLGADVAEIYELAVIPRARGQGIGTRLTLSCLQLARRLGYALPSSKPREKERASTGGSDSIASAQSATGTTRRRGDAT